MRIRKLIPRFVKKTAWYQGRLLNRLRRSWERGFVLLATAPDLELKLHTMNRLNTLDIVITKLELGQGKNVDWTRLERMVGEMDKIKNLPR